MKKPSPSVVNLHDRYEEEGLIKSLVEGKGFEPSTSALRTPRSPN